MRQRQSGSPIRNDQLEKNKSLVGHAGTSVLPKALKTIMPRVSKTPPSKSSKRHKSRRSSPAGFVLQVWCHCQARSCGLVVPKGNLIDRKRIPARRDSLTFRQLRTAFGDRDLRLKASEQRCVPCHSRSPIWAKRLAKLCLIVEERAKLLRNHKPREIAPSRLRRFLTLPATANHLFCNELCNR